MSEIIIFGGTTEGRKLAEFCAENKIHADISVTTSYGAELLPDSPYIDIFTGRLNAECMAEFIHRKKYNYIIDATHPYAVEATRNIQSVSYGAGRYMRLVREKSEISGTVVGNMNELTELLDKNNKTVLSTLGSKELPALTGVMDFNKRIWVRVLPADGIKDLCISLGYDVNKLIIEKGVFTEEQNIHHINMSGAQILLTKESGITGGYPEKVSACRKCGTEIITLARPAEKGYSLNEIQSIIGGV